jgi:hypothetical protein
LYGVSSSLGLALELLLSACEAHKSTARGARRRRSNMLNALLADAP